MEGLSGMNGQTNTVRAVRRRAALFDHLVRAQQNRWRDREAQRRGGLAVHDHLELGRKLHREIARLLAAQDAIHIGGGATEDVHPVFSVRSKPPALANSDSP